MPNFKLASFAIIGYCFDKVSIDLEKKTKDELTLSFETKGLYRGKDKTFVLTFLVKVFSSGEESSFVEVQCRGFFKFEELENFESIPEFFYNNSIAILFPYVRSYISIVTTQANISGIMLPTLNLSALGADLKQNTSEE